MNRILHAIEIAVGIAVTVAVIAVDVILVTFAWRYLS